MSEDKKTKAKKPKSAKTKSAKSKAKVKAKHKEGAEVKVEGQEATPKKVAAKSTTPRTKLLPRTYFAKVGEYEPGWKIIDATGQPLGRLSSVIAKLLMGKDKPYYTRSSDTGDHVIVVNCTKILLTGKKLEDKTYNYHTGFPGGIKTFTAKEILTGQHPERLIKWSVYGMLPKGHMGRRWYKKLRVYVGTEHPHVAQKPEPVKLPDMGFWERA